MRFMGFGFEKINAEKKPAKKDEVKISTKIDIPSITKVQSDLNMGKNEILRVDFSYVIAYEPDAAKIELGGHVLLMDEPKKIKEILDKWKDKQIPDKFKLSIFNIVLRKSTLKALQIEEELNLPPHMPLPSVKPQEEK